MFPSIGHRADKMSHGYNVQVGLCLELDFMTSGYRVLMLGLKLTKMKLDINKRQKFKPTGKDTSNIS